MAVKQIFRLLGTYLKYNTLSAMEYKAAFLWNVFAMVLNNSAFLLIWYFIYQKIGTSIGGYTFNDVMFLWALVAAGFGTAEVFFSNTNQISRIVYSGELDVYLLQPKPVLINLICSRTSISGWGDIVYGVLLFLITQPLSLTNILLFVLFAALYALVLTAIRVIVHSLTFYVGNSEDFCDTYDNLIVSFTLYPGSIYKGLAKALLYSVIPAGILVFIPVELFINFAIQRFFIMLGIEVAILIGAALIFYAGIKKYESGNQITTRL